MYVNDSIYRGSKNIKISIALEPSAFPLPTGLLNPLESEYYWKNEIKFSLYFTVRWTADADGLATFKLIRAGRNTTII